jgi:hypothetical protein
MEIFVPTNNTAVLIAQAEDLARQRADGHLVLFRFTTGWKVVLGTPELAAFSADRYAVSALEGFPSLDIALRAFLKHPAHIDSSDVQSEGARARQLAIATGDREFRKLMQDRVVSDTSPTCGCKCCEPVDFDEEFTIWDVTDALEREVMTLKAQLSGCHDRLERLEYHRR